jgi:DNA-binding transcriptional LysR family regulator
MHDSFLRYFDEVARQGSIRKAATILNVAPTSVARKILATEERLGTKLLHRSPEGIELTAAGKRLLEHCRKTLYDFEKARAEIDDLRDKRQGHLTILTLDSPTFSVLPEVLNRFVDEFPGISLSISAELQETIIEGVLRGEADLGITFTNTLPPELRVLTEKATPFGAIVAADHPLAERISLGVDDLRGYNLVRTLYAREHKTFLDEEIQELAATLSTHVFTNALTVAKGAIVSGNLVGIYTKLGFLEEIAAGKLKFIPLNMGGLAEYRIGLVTSASVGMDPVKSLFLNAMTQRLRGLKLDA